MTAGGTSRMKTCRVTAFAKLLPIGVTDTVATLPASNPGNWVTGAVNVTLTRPLLPVETVEADSRPWSTVTRTWTFARGCAFSSRAKISITDCDAPSSVTVSGVAVTATESASSDGPISGGASTSFTVQPAPARAAAERRTVIRAIRRMVMLIFD